MVTPTIKVTNDLYLYANNYPYKYSSQEQEIDAITGDRWRRDHPRNTIYTEDPNLNGNHLWYWHPSNRDFAAEAAKRGGGIPVNNFQQIVEEIKKRKNVGNVWLYGHGAPGKILFGGYGNNDLTLSSLTVFPDIDLSRYFFLGNSGMIVFACCNSATMPALLQRLANKTHIRTAGFGFRIEWGVQYKGERPHRYVTTRGIVDSRVASLSGAKIFHPYFKTKSGFVGAYEFE